MTYSRGWSKVAVLRQSHHRLKLCDRQSHSSGTRLIMTYLFDLELDWKRIEQEQEARQDLYLSGIDDGYSRNS
ncbi:hypothetical protein [Chroococcidiopsis cubana]|uniref:hypothetical protein n=1 Tax=Chroococcidiopsis cubana TaxID=171392 RepID=UPI000F8F2D03|nr:hypothetical protein [Chroococcidiopsis cubana]